MGEAQCGYENEEMAAHRGNFELLEAFRQSLDFLLDQVAGKAKPGQAFGRVLHRVLCCSVFYAMVFCGGIFCGRISYRPVQQPGMPRQDRANLLRAEGHHQVEAG